MRAFFSLGCLVVLTLTSCDKPAEPPPSCSLESVQNFELGDGTELLIFNVKASGFKRLTARLLVATDGELIGDVTSVEYRSQPELTAEPTFPMNGELLPRSIEAQVRGIFSELVPELAVGDSSDKREPTAPAVSGSLVLLIQDGSAFGVKGKFLPTLAFDLHGSPPYLKSMGRLMSFLWEGELQHSLTSTPLTTPTPLPMRSVLYSQLFSPNTLDVGSHSLSPTRESVVANSKGGRTVVAVELEWSKDLYPPDEPE